MPNATQIVVATSPSYTSSTAAAMSMTPQIVGRMGLRASGSGLQPDEDQSASGAEFDEQHSRKHDDAR